MRSFFRGSGSGFVWRISGSWIQIHIIIQLDPHHWSLTFAATVRPSASTAPPLAPVTITDAEADRFRVAFGSALRNPAFNKVVRRLLHRENMESLAAACPGLQDDLVAQAFLTVKNSSLPCRFYGLYYEQER